VEETRKAKGKRETERERGGERKEKRGRMGLGVYRSVGTEKGRTSYQ